jgi:hypothetical protein
VHCYLLPRTTEHKHTALPVQAMQTHKHECRYSSIHSLPLHHMEESGQLHRLAATSLPGKESPVPIIRVSPRTILGISEHINISRHCGKPNPEWYISYPSLYTNWALPFPKTKWNISMNMSYILSTINFHENPFNISCCFTNRYMERFQQAIYRDANMPRHCAQEYNII